MLLNFVYPSSWIVSVPTSTGNGESGTVSANNYVKGDSAVVCALPLEVFFYFSFFFEGELSRL